jgi:spore germination protein YaaH
MTVGLAALELAALGLAASGWATSARASVSRGGSTAQPAPLQAFVLSSAPDSLIDLEAHAQAIGVAYPTYFECEPATGRVTGADTGAITAYARAQRIAVMPRFNCQDGPTVHRILTNPHVRAQTLSDLAHIAENPAYTGVNLDLENDVATDRAAMSSFVATLATVLHAHARKLSVDVVGVTRENPKVATGFYDDRVLAAAADGVFVIAWGTHWEGSAPGPIAPLSFVAGVARYVASLPHAGRFALGAPMYGLDWPVLAGGSSRGPAALALRYANVLALARSVGATPRRDRTVDEMTFSYTRAGVEHRVWYMDGRAVADRLRIARTHGLAAGVWRLGGEDQELWTSPTVVEGLRR